MQRIQSLSRCKIIQNLFRFLIMQSLFAVAIVIVNPQLTWAGDITVFDVRRPVSMQNGVVLEKDFFINAGTEKGIQPGVVIDVLRRRPLYDTYQNRSVGDLYIRLAKLEIIHSQPGFSVARLYSQYSRKNLPMVDYDVPMVGDQVDISSIKKLKKNKKSAAVFLAPKPVSRVNTQSTEVVDAAPSLPVEKTSDAAHMTSQNTRLIDRSLAADVQNSPKVAMAKVLPPKASSGGGVPTNSGAQVSLPQAH